MIRPRKMKHIELTVLSRDADGVIEYLGRRGIMHLGDEGHGTEGPRAGTEASPRSLDAAALRHIQDTLEKIRSSAAWLGVALPGEPEETSSLPGEGEELLAGRICDAVGYLSGRENEQNQEKRRVLETLNEAKAFANLNAPFAELDQLSYLTLRVGHLDPKRQEELQEALADRAVIIPLGEGRDGQPGDRVLAAASRKGRFALDSELKKMSFVPIEIPDGYQGVPSELLSGLEARLAAVEGELGKIREEKEEMKEEFAPNLRTLAGSYLMASITEQLKARLVATKSIYFLSGWVPQDEVPDLVENLRKITEDRVAVRTFNPDEVSGVAEGREKVPVSLEHGAFVKGFEGVV
ncbi:MAG: V-type ATP synthase subunit I, partial [Treponema sp.]|nr:V-type ATP synthase subunit I [Treponema sp.]